MVKFPEAYKRLQLNIFVCQRCKTKIRAPSSKVIAGKVSCRRCQAKKLRPARKK